MNRDLAGTQYLAEAVPLARLEGTLDQLTWVMTFIAAVVLPALVLAWIFKYSLERYRRKEHLPGSPGELRLRNWGALYRARGGGYVAYVLHADADADVGREDPFYVLLRHLMWRTGPFRLMLPVLAGTVVAVGGWLLWGTAEQLAGLLVAAAGVALLALWGINDARLKPAAGTVRRIAVSIEGHSVDDNPIADLVVTFDEAGRQVSQGRIATHRWRALREAMWQIAGQDDPSRSEVEALINQIRSAAASV